MPPANDAIAPSPLAGEGWGEGAARSEEQAGAHSRHRFGLRFCDGDAEADYQRWRIDVAIPFIRMGMAGVVLAWLCGLVAAAIGMREHLAEFLWWILVGIVPISTIVIALSYAPRLRHLVLPAAMLGNSIGGTVAVWLTYGVIHVPGSAVGSAAIAIFFAFTIFRLPPLRAALAAAPFTLLVLYLLWRDFLVGRLGATEFVGHAVIPVTSFLAGALVCAVMEVMTRKAFRSERIIEQQRRALLEERAQLSRFLSPEVTRMVHERGIVATLEQRSLDLTVVCCDLRGFTRYTELHGPAGMANVLRRYYETVVEVAKRYGGTVKDFAGDGALILIGAPIARDDHAQAGLDLARDLVRAVRAITRSLGSAEAPLGVGAGVASGVCAVGAIGSQSRLEYTAVGSAVNLAARLCSHADDGQILIAPQTASRVPGDSRWRDQVLALKGFDGPLTVQAESSLA